MNESEKERLIKKDIASIENKVRHVFNQGYEMGLKESRSEIPNKWIDAEVLDKIRADIDSHCSDNRDRNDGLYIAMKIIDKYKAESEAQE